MHSIVQPDAWVALKLPSERLRVIQVAPNTTISLGKYGSFPSNLIIHRPYHLTYELQDKKADESFSRLRVVPPSELYSDILADEGGPSSSGRESVSLDETDRVISAQDGIEYSLVEIDSDAVIARTNREIIDDNARQTLTPDEIEMLKREGTDAGKDLIAKLMLSHTALDQKTVFSLAKYKLLKTRKYIRRFSVLPLDVTALGNYLLEDKEVGSKILELREEITALLGCWANVHYGGQDRYCDEPGVDVLAPSDLPLPELEGGRWLVVDDTGGFLVAAMAERMGILYPPEESGITGTQNSVGGDAPAGWIDENGNDAALKGSATLVAKEEDDLAKPEAPCAADTVPHLASQPQAPASARRRKHVYRHDDFYIPYSLTNTLTVIHANSQPNLTYLKYYDYDCTAPGYAGHPLEDHLLTLTWLQLIEPENDSVYSSKPPNAPADLVLSWKPNRRGNYHRKRRRWTKARHTVDSTRAGGFSGLVVASTMDPVSILRHALPLLASGAPIAIYSHVLEPLTTLADCFSIPRRAAWTANPPAETVGQSAEELVHWKGSPDFPLNPSLLLGVNVQTSRARKWQVLPGRTHPVMTSRGGAEGYVFTAWRAQPAEGRIEARGKFKKWKPGPAPAQVSQGIDAVEAASSPS